MQPVPASLVFWRTTLFAALGLVPLGACGGISSAGSTRDGQQGGPFLPCVDPAPWPGADGNPSGFVECAGGGLHRVEKRACTSALPQAGTCPALEEGITSGCQTDADCTERPNGYCAGAGDGSQLLGYAPGCYCRYGCLTDADCGDGSLCLCGQPVGHCVAAACSVDSDCAGGALCLSYTQDPGCGGTAFACQTAGDTCTGGGDCASGYCSLVDGAHHCENTTCAIGRPFLILGEARLAGTTASPAWASALDPCCDGLDAETRATLGARWTEIALMEHASIAAFARFALELLSLGAPPELVTRTHRAMADETAHARDAFGLAAAYLGRPVGPGKLDTRSALEGRSPVEIVRTAILEGCIGETVAAVEAAEALAHATDPVVRRVLARVTQDEA
jgi:hypothetical protein